MANNGGRQAGGGGNNQMNVHISFKVKPEEDLYLSGDENTIRRVVADTHYNCLMVKTQRFSTLFRHYAKYNGLRKDDLEYSFVNPLENDDTPDSVQLKPGDTITVRKRRKPEPPEAAADDEEFFKNMKEMLDDEEHMDCIFLVLPDICMTTDESTGTGARSNHRHHHDRAAMGTSSTSSAAAHVTKSSTSSTTATTTAPANKSNVKQKANDDNNHNMDNPYNSDDNTGATAAIAASASIADTATTAAANAATSTYTKSSITDFGNKIPIRAHKCVLTARAEYFRALFCNSQHTATGSTNILERSFRKSEACIIHVEPDFGPIHIRCLLEFIYTNSIQHIKVLSTDNLLSLLHLSDRWLLRDLKGLIEHELISNHISMSTIARIYGATESFKAQRLSTPCIDFTLRNLAQLTRNAVFEQEIENHFHLCMPILKAAVDLIPVHKKLHTDLINVIKKFDDAAAGGGGESGGEGASGSNAAGAGGDGASERGGRGRDAGAVGRPDVGNNNSNAENDNNTGSSPLVPDSDP